MEVSFSPTFLRAVRGLPQKLREEVIEKVDCLKDPKNHQSLKVHKLHGQLRDTHAFSVNYRFRVIFQYVGKPRRAYLLAVGDHDLYDR